MARFLALLTFASTLLVATGQPSGFHGWANNFGGYLSFTCPSNQVLDGWYGVFSNSRLNSITYRSFGGYENSYYGGFTKTCPNGQAIYRIQAGHSDGYRDRPHKQQRTTTARTTAAARGVDGPTTGPATTHTTSTTTSTTSTTPSTTTTTSFTANSKYVIRGVQSDFSYTFRDRRWRFYQCRVSCRSGWVQSGTECTCPSGSYQRGNDCVSSRKCGRGQYAASSSNNRYCYDCRPGTFQSDSSHTDTTCSSCPAGKFQDDYGRADCETCPSSQYNPYTGRSSCRDCSSGYYRSSPSTQTRCQPGYRCPGSCSRIACSPGTYQNSYRQVSCKSCEAGKYQTESGASSCNNCANGYYTTSAASAPRRCQPGFACSSCNRRACNGEFYQNAAGQSDCKRASQCGAGQYVSRGPSQTTDRVCGSCSLGRTYQDASSHTFGSCKPVRNCPAGTFVAADPTLSSDRVCGKCQEGTYSSGVNAKQCEDIGTCDAGEYAFFASSTSGVDCRACALGSTYQDETNHNRQSCKTVSPECPAGQFQAVAPTRSNDRVCNDCHPGTFSDRPGGDECDPHTQCGAGFIETSPATPTSDRACRRCNGVTQYQDEQHQSSCKTVRTCSSTQYETTAPSPSNNRVCASCTTSCPSGKVLVGTCGPTTDKRCESCHPSCATCDGTTENDCLSCADSSLTLLDGRCVNPDCGEGEYRDGATCKPCDSSCAECDGAGSNRCISCKGDRYLDGNSCVTKCPTGYFKFTNSERDNVCRRCTSCDDGTFASTPCDGNTFTDTQCSPWSTCDEGEEEDTPPNSVRDRVCRKCEADKEYQDQPGKLFCKSVSVCQRGQYVSTEPTLTTDRQCSACGTGTFTNSENAARCLPCAAGSFQDETNSPSCQECGIGMYEPEQGQTQCAEIPPGYYGVGGTISTRTGIAECPRGYYCLGGSHDKQACPPNQYQSETGQSQCVDLTVCGDGELVSKEPTSISDRECSPCPDGTCDAPETFQDKENQRTCRPVSDCPVGTAELVGPTPTSDRKCRACQVGTNYADDTGLEICKPVTNCRPGTREVAAPTASSDRVCQACGPNTYTESENEKTCRPHTLCGAGEKEVEEPTTSSNRRCVPCDDDTFQDSNSHSVDSCTRVTTCEPGEYLATPATRTSDAVCKSCKLGETFSTTDNAEGCMPVSMCGLGEREKQAPTTSTDRVCEACRDGYFQDSASHAYPTCKEWTDCSPGEYILVEGSTFADRVCDDCSGVVTYQPKANQDNCLNVTRCEENTQYELTPPAANRDRVCADCTDASTCNTNEYLAGTCGGNEGTENTRCAACHPTCNGCTGPAIDECTACGPNLQLRNGRCISECPDGEYELGNGCAECHSTCADCDGPDATNCLLCDGNLNLWVDEQGQSCIADCPPGYYAKDHRCVPCTSCGMGTWASTPCSASSDAVCSPWTECKPGQKESVSGNAVRDRACVSCTLGMEYQPLPDRASCFPTSVCEDPFIETIPPTLTTDRLCSCDTLTCNKLITQLFEEMVCAEPTDEQLDVVLDVCCSGQGEDGIRDTIRQMDAYEARRSCPGCTDTCECSAGFILVYDADSADCLPCDGVTEFSPSVGGSKCEPIEECERGQEEVSAPTRSSDRVCRDCPAGTIDSDSDGSTGCQMCPAGHYTEAGSHGSCSSFTCRAGTHDHDSDAATPCHPCVFGITYQDEEGQTTCKDVTECAPGFEEVQAMTLISDRVCDECPEGTYKAVSGQGVPCLPVTTCDAGEEETAKPTPTSDRVCSQCELGATFKPVDGQAESCRPVTQCGPDEEEIREPTRQHDRLCRKCVQDITYRPAGSDTCVPVSRCAASEYISTHATLTTDVQCTAVGKCEFGTFQSQAPTLDSDRECTECSECPSGRYEIRACSALEDVQCAGCSACPPNTYILRACDSENDVSCQQCSTCSDEQYRSAPCTSTSDTECTTLDVCDQDQFELFPATPTTDRICRDLTQCNPSMEYERTAPTASSNRLCHLITKCDPGEQRIRAPTSTSDAKCEPCPIGTTDHDRNPLTACQPCPYGHYVPAGSIGSCEQFLCPAGTADLDRNASTPCTPCQAGLDFAALSGQRDCTPVTECDLGYEEVVRPTIFTDRQCRRCIEGLFYRDSSTDFCTRVSPCEPGSFETAAPTISTDRECQMGRTCPNNTFISRPLTPTQNRICSPWTQCLSNEYELVAPSLVNDRECQRVRSCQDTEYEVSAPTATTDRLCATISTCPMEQFEVLPPTTTSDRVCAPAYSVSLIFDAKFNALAGTQSRREAFEAALVQSINTTQDASQILRIDLRQGSIIATVASLNEDFTARLFNRSVSGDITVMGFTASPCEADEFLDDSDPNPFAPVLCSLVEECRSNQFEVSPPTSTTDRECQTARICRLGEYVVSEFTATTDRVCGTTTTTTTTTTSTNATTTPLASTGSAASLSPGILAVIALVALLVLVVAIVLVVWRNRKATKDRRQNEAIQQWATMNKASDEISQANTLLRQLSLRDQSVLLFDNPMFSQPGGNQRPDWYVGQMTRAEAEDFVLKNSGNVGDFVVRESAANGNFVLTLLIEGNQFEHHKLYKDAQGRFLINGNRPKTDCMTLDVLIDHLSRTMDGTSALLNLQEEYGQVRHAPQAAEPEGDFYGALSQEQQDFYGSVVKKDRPTYMHGPLARGEAEAILAQDRTKGNFLVRESKARPGTYAISLVIDDGRVEHHSLRHNGSEFVLNDIPLSVRCNTVSEVINHLATNEESMSCPLRLQQNNEPVPEVPGMEGFSNPNYTREGPASSSGGYDPLTAPRGVVANPGYQDLPPKPTHLVGGAADASTVDDDEDAPPVNVRTLPKPFHLLPPEKHDASA
ncbi:p75 neurotrophin receptor b [Salpingoeca rosetta]|uniref:p75 neurotrophin receptor b n=1 Tax=Salpingoeca rosetta (strain ATCC 50818 / BSB-021) TaxID=946362 RepID=F2US73_SALR5|nr:p75 neurotrophin receptor b [Salpingoeca rosetta]EGD80478.1 p75 neurotrophin receptor b [Salpingoeca rosetta]|eukprot:XP_004988042.1 p75 neurotrophin receptor b [Salpingoeca rosetta]